MFIQCYCATSSQYGRTAVHMAAKCGHTETVRVLLQRGVDPNQCATNVHVSDVILCKGTYTVMVGPDKPPIPGEHCFELISSDQQRVP